MIGSKFQSQVNACQRLAKMGGIGPLISTALVAAVGNATEFKNGRHMAASLGLVPRQHSSGGQQRLLGISKRGDREVAPRSWTVFGVC
jgi:transposase